MISLAPNVYVLAYLSATKQLSGASEENAYRFIQSGRFRITIQWIPKIMNKVPTEWEKCVRFNRSTMC